jgi:hypothetical protein
MTLFGKPWSWTVFFSGFAIGFAQMVGFMVVLALAIHFGSDEQGNIWDRTWLAALLFGTMFGVRRGELSVRRWRLQRELETPPVR